MSYIIRISCQDHIWNVDLSDRVTASIGSSEKDTVQILTDGIEKGQVSFFKDESGLFNISGNSLFRIVGDTNSPVFFEKIDVWNMYCVEAKDEVFITIHPKQSDWNRMIPIKGIETITIGRNQGNRIILRNGRTSGKHCKIYKEESKYFIKDLGSTNGTYVNGDRITEQELHDGDWISLSIYQILIQNGNLYLFNTGGDIYTDLDTTEISIVPVIEDQAPENSPEPEEPVDAGIQPVQSIEPDDTEIHPEEPAMLREEAMLQEEEAAGIEEVDDEKTY